MGSICFSLFFVLSVRIDIRGNKSNPLLFFFFIIYIRFDDINITSRHEILFVQRKEIDRSWII